MTTNDRSAPTDQIKQALRTGTLSIWRLDSATNRLAELVPALRDGDDQRFTEAQMLLDAAAEAVSIQMDIYVETLPDLLSVDTSIEPGESMQCFEQAYTEYRESHQQRAKSEHPPAELNAATIANLRRASEQAKSQGRFEPDPTKNAQELVDSVRQALSVADLMCDVRLPGPAVLDNATIQDLGEILTHLLGKALDLATDLTPVPKAS